MASLSKGILLVAIIYYYFDIVNPFQKVTVIL